LCSAETCGGSLCHLHPGVKGSAEVIDEIQRWGRFDIVAKHAFMSPLGGRRQDATKTMGSLIVGVDPSIWMPVGVVARLLIEAAKRVNDKAVDHVTDQLWQIVRKQLDPKELDALKKDPYHEDWPRRLCEQIEPLLAADRQLAVFTQRLLFGERGCDQARWRLPADNPDFINRGYAMFKLRKALDRDPDQVQARPNMRDKMLERFGRGPTRAGTAAAIVEITGPPLIGKSELAIHLAHHLRSKYPDGCFILDLGGPLGWSHAVTDGLVDLLRAQGVARSEIPGTRELALSRYWAWFHGKRALVIIENARDDKEIRTFLPPEDGCAAIITSNRRVTDLSDERLCELEPFSEPYAIDLLRTLDRSNRTWTPQDPDAQAIVTWCGRHPAVMATVAAWISQPHLAVRSVAEIAATLWQPAGHGATDVLGSSRLWEGLQRHYGALSQDSPEVARLFRLIGLLGVPNIDSDVAMTLTNLSRYGAERALETLVDARLLMREGPYDRIAALHQRFAESRAREEEDRTEQRKALIRTFKHYLEREKPWATTRAAETFDELDRLSRERANLVSTVMRAFTERLYDLTWRLSVHCARFFEAHHYLGAWEATARIGLRAADLLDQEDRRLKALTLTQMNLDLLKGSSSQQAGQPIDRLRTTVDRLDERFQPPP
jgi:hypothetical protein